MDPHWIWLSIGILLAAAEIVAPGFFLIWVGAAAIATGVIAWIVPLGVPLQLGIFGILSFAALYGARRWLKANPIPSADPLLNQRGHRLVGEIFTLTQAIEDGRRRHRVGDGEWPVRGAAAPECAKDNGNESCGGR